MLEGTENRTAAVALVVVTLLGAACSVRDVTSVPTTPPAPPPVGELTLTADSIGEVGLGTPPEDAIAALTPLIGGADGDTGWIDASSGIFGRCPGEVRVVNWGSLALFFGPQPDEGLFAYSYGFEYGSAEAGVDPRELDLKTVEGIGLETTVAELEGRAPYAVIDGDAVIDVWTFAIDPGEVPHLRGRLTGPDPDGTVLFIETSTGCE